MSVMKLRHHVAKVTKFEEKRGYINIGDLIVVTSELFNFHGKGYVLAASCINNRTINFIGLISSDCFELCEKSEMTKDMFNMILDSSFTFLFPTSLKDYQVTMERIDSVGCEKFYEPEKPIAEMTNHELRNYVTVFSEQGYSSYNALLNQVNVISYDKKEEIATQLNSEFNKRVGKTFLDFYEFFDSFINKEKWGGELRYTVLSYGGTRKTNELKCVERANMIKHFDFSKHEDVMKALKLARNGYLYELPMPAEISIPHVCNSKEVAETFERLETELERKNELVDSILTNFFV